MSTKLHNGYTVQVNNLEDLHGKLIKLGREVQKIQTQILTKIVIEKAVGMLDDHSTGKKVFIPKEVWANKLEGSPLVMALMLTHERERQIQITNHRDPDVDTEFTVCLLPTKRLKRASISSRLGSIFAIIYTEQQTFRDLWDKQNWIKEYGWDNTDHPKELTGKQWMIRRNDWQTALRNWKVPAEVGFVFSITQRSTSSLYRSYTPQEISDNMPTLTVRAKRIVQNHLLDVRNTHLLKRAIRQGRKMEMSHWVKEYKWLMTPAGKAAIRQLMPQAKKKLIPTVTREVLLQNIPVELLNKKGS